MVLTAFEERLIQQGWFLRIDDDRRKEHGVFYYVDAAVLGKSVHTWGDGVAALAPVTTGQFSEGETMKELEPTSRSILHQVFFGVDRVGTLIYVRLPTSVMHGGFDQQPRTKSSNRFIGEIDGAISPYDGPAVETEFFCRTDSVVPFPEIDCFNNTRFSQTPQIRLWVNRLMLSPVVSQAALDKLQNKLIPFRPVRLDPLPAGGGAPAGGGG